MRKNTKGLIIKAALLLLILITSIVATVYFYGPGDIKKRFYARSIGEAADSCEEEIDGHFSKHLISKHYDQISSRYDASRKQYIIFYRISHRKVVDGIPSIEDSMAKCAVWESLGYVSDFSVFKP